MTFAIPPQTYVVVPAYNEAPALPATVGGLLQAGYQVVVVDDASTDDTPQVLDRQALHYLRHRVNLGQGAALQTGMDYARSLGAQWVIHFDADGQHRVEDLPALLAPLLGGQADVALGSRFLRGDTGTMPRGRRRLLRAAIWINGLFTGLWLSDAHCGLRALNRQALDRIRLRSNRMAHATEILTQIRRTGLRYTEVPVEVRYTDYARQKGQSFRHAFGILGDLILRNLFSP
ncbi:MAG: glycosyltransferase family 2 protein [Bacteroidia bacterium]